MNSLREQSIEDCKKIGQGVAGVVYALDDDRIVKVAYGASPDRIEEQMNREFAVAKELADCGIPTPRAYEMVTADGSIGIIYERIKGEDLVDYIKAHRDEVGDIAVKISRILNKLHHITPQIDGLHSMKEMLLGFIPMIAPLYSDDELESLKRDIEDVPDADTYIHGDLNPGNFMLDSSGELKIIDMGTVSVGHAYFEFSNMIPAHLMLDDITYGKDEAYVFSAKRMGEPDVKELISNIDLMKELYDRLIEGYFEKLPGEHQKRVAGNIWITAYQKVISLYARLPLSDEKKKQENINKLKEKYFTQRKQIPGFKEWWPEEGLY